MSTAKPDDGDAVAVPPGATLQETIDSLGMTQRELALRTGMAPKTINEIINGKAPITPATSILLERVTGIPARMWNNLESNYRERLARTADCDRLQRENNNRGAAVVIAQEMLAKLEAQLAAERDEVKLKSIALKRQAEVCDRLRRELDDTKAQLEACEIWRDRLRVEAAKARQTECPNCDRLQRELDEARAQVAKGKP